MQVANRTTRRYITPTSKNSIGNIRSTAKKSSNPPPISHTSPKKAADISTSKANEPTTLKKLVDRFRYDDPQPRPERDSINSDFWWLHDELKATCDTAIDDDDDERRSNVPEFIEIFPSTDIDQDLNKRASLLLNQTFSAHSSDVGHVSSTGIGSTPSTTMTTTTTSTFQPVVHEQAARPIFTRINESKYDFKTGNGDDDILYQWRLRRRLEQAQNGEPITFPSKVTSRTNVPPARSFFPSIPVEIPTVILPPPPPPAPVPLVVTISSPKRDRQQSSTTNNETESIKPISTTPIPVRHCSEVATQTIQDACIQTSPVSENRLSSLNEPDLQPTRDDDNRSSVWHRPPARSKYEITQVSTSPSPIKRHHHHHHHHSFRPVVITGQPTTTNTSHQHHHHHHRSNIYPSTNVQSSQDSTLTHVTSIMINDNHAQIRHPNNNDIIDELDERHQQSDNVDDHIIYSNDEILNILIQKRDELLIAFRDIEQRLTNMIS